MVSQLLPPGQYQPGKNDQQPTLVQHGNLWIAGEDAGVSQEREKVKKEKGERAEIQGQRVVVAGLQYLKGLRKKV